MLQSPSSSIETRSSWVVATVALAALMVAFGANWITVVALKDIAAEVNGTRSIPAFASALAWLGPAWAASSWARSPTASARAGRWPAAR
jgi:hypothetical protein